MPLEYVTFNSLSRDHYDPRYITVRGDEILSTPSLGITLLTVINKAGFGPFQLSTPSLGITSCPLLWPTASRL